MFVVKKFVRKLPRKKPSRKRIFQDVWFEKWFLKKDELLNERFIEYAWVLRHLNLDRGSILDVGCGASYFPLLLSLQGFDVTALDTHNFDYGFPYYKFIQGDASSVKLDRKFDRITMISTLEHIGTQQQPYDKTRDSKTITNLGNYLKPNGLWLVTVPFGKEKYLPQWRVYTQRRLNKLFPNIVKQEYFIREVKFWRKTRREEVEKLDHPRGPSIAITCFVAKRKNRIYSQ